MQLSFQHNLRVHLAPNCNVAIISAFVAESLTDQTCWPGWELAVGFCWNLFNLRDRHCFFFLGQLCHWYYIVDHHYFLTMESCNTFCLHFYSSHLSVTVSVPWVATFLTFPVCFAKYAATNWAENPICTFFWMLLQCCKYHVHHMSVTNLTGCYELILHYTAKHTSWLVESVLSSHSVLKCLFPMIS